MLIGYIEWNPLDGPHYCLTCCVSWICFRFYYLSIHVSYDYENVVFRDATNNGGNLVIEDLEVLWSLAPDRAVAGYDRCAGVTIKPSFIILGRIFLMLLRDFGARELRRILHPNDGIDRTSPRKCWDKSLSIDSIVVFYSYFTMMWYICLYTYYVYIIFYRIWCQLR